MGHTLIHVVRSVRADPWFAFSVVLTLGLGLGLSTSAFTLVDRLALRLPDGVAKPNGLRRVEVSYLPSRQMPSAMRMTSVSYPEYESIVRALDGTAEVTAYGNWPDRITARINGRLEPARVLATATNYFAVLRVQAWSGRLFATPSMLAAAGIPPPEAIISYSYWTRVFGRRPSAIGTTISLPHQQVTVVGVAPPRFDGLGLDGPDLWISWQLPVVNPSSDWQHDPLSRPWAVVLRLPAEGALPAISGRIQTAVVAAGESQGTGTKVASVSLMSLTAARTPDFEREIKSANALWLVSVIVLLAAAINAGGLFLVRGWEQQRAMAIAMALGASRRRIIAIRVLEGVLLAFSGSLLGILLARVGSEVMRSAVGSYVHWTQAAIDFRPAAYAVLAALLVGAVTSAWPAIRASRTDPRLLLEDGGHGTGKGIRRSSVLIHSVQVACAVVGLYGAGLFVVSALRARATPLGMNIQNVLVASVRVENEVDLADGAPAFWQRIMQRVNAVPGIVDAALSTSVVFRSFGSSRVDVQQLASFDQQGTPAFVQSVTPSYLRTLDISLLAGRNFVETDRAAGVPVALVNRSGARRLWPGEEAIGRCVRVGAKAGPCARVVGVIADTRRMELDEPEAIQVLLPLARDAELAASPYLIVRFAPGRRREAEAGLRQILLSEAIGSTSVEIGSLSDDLAHLTSKWVNVGRVLSVFGSLAILITCVGIYATLAYDLLQRRQEFGIRLALGAEPRQFVRSVVLRGTTWSLGGIAIGLLGTLWFAPLIKALLFATDPWDPRVLVSVVTLVLLGGAAAGWLGARRAAISDLSSLLRVR